MKTSKFTEEQFAFTLNRAELGTPVKEIIRKVGNTEQAFYRWKKKYCGLGTNELRRLRHLEEENKRLKQMVADLSLDQQQRMIARMEKEEASPREENLLLKTLIRRAVVDTEKKEVAYSLAIPIEKLVGPDRGCGETGSEGGCTEVMAEVHGNRTHPRALHPCTGFEDQETHQAPWHFRCHNV
jgi:putative transposase